MPLNGIAGEMKFPRFFIIQLYVHSVHLQAILLACPQRSLLPHVPKLHRLPQTVPQLNTTLDSC